MTATQTLEQLRALGSEPTRTTYLRHGLGPEVLGVSFAHLGQLKKQFVGRGKDRQHAHQVARELWHTGYFEARQLATMIADPAQLAPAEAAAWVVDVQNHGIADALATLLAQTSFALEATTEMLTQPGEFQQRTAYTLLNLLAQKNQQLPDSYFEPYITRIEQHIHAAPNRAKEGMNNCLIGIGGRSEALRRHVEATADRLGPVRIDHGETNCQTFEIRPYLAKMWARKAKAASHS